MSGYLYFSNNLYMVYGKLQNLPINGNSFQRKTKLIATTYIFSSIRFVFETTFISEQIAGLEPL